MTYEFYATPDIVKRVRLKFTSMAYRILHGARDQRSGNKTKNFSYDIFKTQKQAQ